MLTLLQSLLNMQTHMYEVLYGHDRNSFQFNVSSEEDLGVLLYVYQYDFLDVLPPIESWVQEVLVIHLSLSLSVSF